MDGLTRRIGISKACGIWNTNKRPIGTTDLSSRIPFTIPNPHLHISKRAHHSSHTTIMDSPPSSSPSSSSSPESPRSNRRRNRSNEEEYAGPLQYETPARSVSPESTPQPKRLKRSSGSSDENQKSSQVHSLTVEDYRIAGPIYMPIPIL